MPGQNESTFVNAALALEGKSPETILWHNKKLSAFLNFMQPNGSQVKICELTLDDARRFIRSLMERKTKYSDHKFHREIEGGLAPQTIHGFVRSLKTFASWLAEEGYTEEHIFGRLQPPQVPQILIEPLTEDEIRRLLTAIPQDTLEGVRNFAILLFAFLHLFEQGSAKPSFDGSNPSVASEM